MIGTQLEHAGWRQGAIIKDEDTENFLSRTEIDSTGDEVLIVASQSCDIAFNDLALDPYIEISVARKIPDLNGNMTFNKNPRVLHTAISIRTQDNDVLEQQYIECLASLKIQIDKQFLVGFKPDNNRVIEQQQIEHYAKWLASRYSRPALPTEFNDRIAKVDPRDKRKKKGKAANEALSGIYVEIFPYSELPENEDYKVNLLGLVPADFDGNLQIAQKALDEYAEILREARMDVTVVLQRENEVSIATIKRFKRFYYDHLSYKDGAPRPPEVETNL